MLKLAPREQQVAELVSKGYSNEEVAEALGLKLKSVKACLTIIYGKMGLKKRWQLIERYERHKKQEIKRQQKELEQQGLPVGVKQVAE